MADEQLEDQPGTEGRHAPGALRSDEGEEDVEGHRVSTTTGRVSTTTGRVSTTTGRDEDIGEDVEGHRWTTETRKDDSEDDVEGHMHRPK